MGTSYSSKLFSEFPQFVFDESDELAEMKSRWNPTGSGKKKFRSGYSPVDNYTFLQSLAGGKERKGKKLRDETVIIHEDDDAVKERIVRSDTALQSSSSDYNSKSFAGSKSSDFITPKPLKAPTQRFCLADNEPVSLISDEDSDTSSEMSSNDLADTQGSSGEQSLVQEITSHEMEPSVVLHPKYTTYEGNCYWSAKLTFLPSSIKLNVSEEEAPMGPLTYEWKTVDLICIESKWLDPFPTADVCLHFKLEHPKQPISNQKSGIMKVNFTVCDPNWDSMQELIKSLDEQYKEKWEVDLDSYELFEDITYRGDCDCISISKRDFQLLHPEKFINDTIVDFYIEYLKKINPADERVHFFNSFFFRKLADFDENQLQMFDAKESFQRVRKWTKKVDIFQKDYIFIPVNFRLHWSLIIICHPGEVVSFEDEELEVSVKVPCILHMDSIKGSHRGIENCIKCYLWEEWKQRSSNRAEDISTKFKNLRFLRLEVPQQQNSYDCGLFMLHYMELFMKQAPSSFNPLSNFISKDWFFPTEASLKRGRIKRLIIELAKSRSEQVLSPNCNDEFSSEDKDVIEEESEDVEILNETCHGRSSTPLMVKPLRSEPYKSDCEESGDDEDSLIDDDDEQNHGKLVLYDPSVAVLSPTKESKAKEEVDNEKKQVAIVSGKNESESFMTCLDKSLNLLQLKERNQPEEEEEDVDVFVVEKKDDESDDDVFETCVVEDSDSSTSCFLKLTMYCVVHEQRYANSNSWNKKSVCNCSYSRCSDPMCRHEARAHLSQEEQTAAEESLSVYCKPVELYNILQRRAVRNPSFLQRCLHYKLQAKQKRRVQISVSISGATNDGLQTQSLFPMYMLLARAVSTTNVETQCTTVYRFNRACKLTAFGGADNTSSAKFILPEMNKLSTEVKSGSLAVLLVSCADTTNLQGIDLTEDHMFSASLNRVGYCLFGKIPMDLLQSSWEKSPTLSLGGRAEMMSTVIMQSCFMKLSCLDGGKCVSFHFPYNSEAVSILQQVQVIVSAEEVGAKNMSPYDMYSYNDTPRPGIMRLRSGNVIFNYKYYNNMLQRTEVTEDFSCPFCLVKCASYKGLRFHLTSSHDLFRYEFWVTEDYQVVIVSMRTDICSSEIIPENVDPKQQMFFYCYKSARHRKPKAPTQNAKHVHPLVLDSAMSATLNELIDNTDCVAECMEHDTCSPDASATCHSFAELESVQSVPENNLQPPMLQFAKTRKLSAERSDPRNRALLQKRQFFHSHRAQPMALEQVFAERDSEDEVDDDVADLEDRRMLDDFVDVSKDEKQMMHLWNSFVRKQRVLADGHIPWACEAFSKLHGQDLVQAPSLLWCWRLFMIKIWNHGLLDSRTLNNCNVILENYQNQSQEIDPIKMDM